MSSGYLRKSDGDRCDEMNDNASYFSDTSSITNPTEFDSRLGFSHDQEDDLPPQGRMAGIAEREKVKLNGFPGANQQPRASYGATTPAQPQQKEDEFSIYDSATSALTGLTGWTSMQNNYKNKNGVISRQVTRKSDISELGESATFPLAKSFFTEPSVVSSKVSTISFDVNGSIEASMDDFSQYDDLGNKITDGASDTRIHSKKSSPTHSMFSQSSNNSGNNRAPVPPLRDPALDDSEQDQMWEEDCNYDINPTLMFLVLESQNWEETVKLLDGKGLENKDNTWNLGSLFGGKKQDEERKALLEKRQAELRVQARTWIVRRERSGVLKWRMLPLHAALAFNAPFEVFLRLYHLYPGAVRCRNYAGMLPLHHTFKYGNEDKVLELLLDVFPEALTVRDDKGRLPVECTPQDGSDNERRSRILELFANFQVKVAMNSGKCPPPSYAASEKRDKQEEQGTLGAEPRYGSGENFLESIAANQPAEKAKDPTDDDEDSTDRYSLPDGDDESENNPRASNTPQKPVPSSKLLKKGLSPIPEDCSVSSPSNAAAQKIDEYLALSEKKRNRGIRKLLRRKKKV